MAHGLCTGGHDITRGPTSTAARVNRTSISPCHPPTVSEVELITATLRQSGTIIGSAGFRLTARRRRLGEATKNRRRQPVEMPVVRPARASLGCSCKLSSRGDLGAVQATGGTPREPDAPSAEPTLSSEGSEGVSATRGSGETSRIFVSPTRGASGATVGASC
eukprot:CAMPEP_0181174570 /NCGR_PEP_ID=MMETSP1096-20121128/3614_1 /TAXON_ID=156174 ORGANISM="Chrysochromulina ericina, Strain CCMP281" /NCGR_SAMPLE_ID=MMETSP1096 /ASSEMBLY_ACC=CAM_ASM_000453 /LENGTH=162 /DNA_ID=CAMNT_0023262495 /DNA_START=215 /DNA_END=703 /DNA_ORIENTATION=+